MISIPVSFLLAAAFLGLGLSTLFWKSVPIVSRLMFLGLFLLVALEAVLVGVRFAYGNFAFVAVQRALPVWIAPAAYLAFCSLAEPPAKLGRRVGFNGLAAILVTLAMYLRVPVDGYADGLIAASFIVYTVTLVRLWRDGPDRFSQAPTELGSNLHRLLLAAILLMVATLLLDGVIAYLFTQDRRDTAATAISLASLLFLASALVLAVISTHLRRSAPRGAGDTGNREEASGLVAAARTLLDEQGLYRDQGLTLTRLARRVGVPDRDLSRAINAVTGMNVSQFVNQVRLEAAARQLETTDDPVTRIQERAGFLTRSNFYREFQRVYGETPGNYRKKLTGLREHPRED
ncbi:AraC family transcriptional regulator [Roseibium sp.]|uniref:helix-turn-helix transcriptional regulator n=1 Tax=Roseibium sp. TaxID=1936156 RepID=UPI003265285A